MRWASVRSSPQLAVGGATHCDCALQQPVGHDCALHAHWLFTLEHGVLSRVVGRAKTLSSRDVRKLRPDLDAVWQKEYFDRALRADETFRLVGEYIVANPVRAGLVEHAGLYSHWFAEWL